jgi:hypothetical protein
MKVNRKEGKTEKERVWTQENKGLPIKMEG